MVVTNKVPNEDGGSFATAIVRLNSFSVAVEEYSARTRAIVVKSDVDLTTAAVFVKELRDEAGRIEEQRKELVKPFNDGVKALNALAKKVIDPLLAMKGLVEQRMSIYQVVRQRALDKAAADERRCAEAKAARLETKGKADEAATVRALAEMRENEPVSSVVRGDGVSTSLRTVWQFTIKNENDVPREYCRPDEPLIRHAVLNGVREIAGVRIFSVDKTNVR